jgi:phage-related protein
MKKIVLFCLVTAIIGGSIFAQSNTPTTTIRGTRGLSNGRISVVSNNITYYVRGLERFVGFIDGLKEGAQVSLDGYASVPTVEGQTDRLFRAVKLTLNGKIYEVGSPDSNKLRSGRDGKGKGTDSRKGRR